MSTNINKSSFGTLASGEQVDLYTLKQHDLQVSFCTFGGIITAIKTPDKQGNWLILFWALIASRITKQKTHILVV